MTPSRLTTLAVLLAALALPPGPAAGDSGQLATSQTELQALRARIEAVNRQVAGDRSERDGLRTALQSAEQQASRATQRLRTLETDLANQQRDVAAARARQREASAELDRHSDQLAAQIRAAYLLGKQSRLKLLLSQEDPARLQRTLTQFDYLNRARAERIETVRAAVAELTDAEAALRAGETQLRQLRDEQQQTVERLRASRAERERTVAAIDRRLREGGEQLAAMARDETRLQGLIDRLRDALADIPARLEGGRPLQELRGQLLWPLTGPVLAGFGQPKAGGQVNWRGIWIGADEGAAVQAIAHGRVAWVGWMHRYGLVVILEHEGGWFSLYGHSQSSNLRTGQWVRAGEVVARAGNTGGHDRHGVYLELRRGADPVDPISWLRRRGG